MTSRTPPPGRSAPPQGARRRPPRRRATAGPRAPGGFEEVTDRAARLGVTAERVLAEYARIAFFDLRHIVEWRDGKLAVKDMTKLSAEDAAPISEISADDKGSRVRVKLYDKKAALDAIARHLGMFPQPPKSRAEDGAPDDAEALRAELLRRLDRLAADNADPETGPAGGRGDKD